MFENIGQTLTFLREVKRLSQRELAERAGLGKSQLSKYENGRELPKLDSLERILNALGADFELFAGTLALANRNAALLNARCLPSPPSDWNGALPGGVGSWLERAITSLSSAGDDLLKLREAVWVRALAQPSGLKTGRRRASAAKDEENGGIEENA